MAELDEEAERLRRDLAMARLELEEALQSGRNDAARLAALRAENEELQRGLAEMSEKLARADARTAALRAERETLKDELRGAAWRDVRPELPPTDECAALRAEVDRLRGGLLYLSAEAREPQPSPVPPPAEPLPPAEGHPAELQGLRDCIQRLRAELGFKSALNEELRQRFADLKAEGQGLARSLDLFRRERLLGEVQADAQRRLQAMGSLDALNRRLRAAYTQCLGLFAGCERAALTQLEKQLNDCTTELKELRELLFSA